MSMTIILFVLACGCVVWCVITTLLIYENLRRRGEQVSFIWLRAAAPWYASRYRKITKQETGKVGSLFYHWIVSINSVPVFTVLAFVVHNL